MTADDVVEAMARGIHNANPGVHEPWANIVAAEALGNRLAERTAALRRAEARAAIRAVTERGGLVVAKMPGEWSPVSGDDGTWTTVERAKANLRVTGWNAALAEVRAAAVEVKP